MTKSVLVCSCLCLMLAAPVFGEDTGERITWAKDLPSAFGKARADKKILMICVNARSVAGEKEEPAAKGLRDVVYKDARVVKASRAFVCALLTRQGGSEDYGELRALGIDGTIVSPQHIFVHPNGKQILLRRQYWSYGQGDAAVDALLAMMEKARAKLGVAPPEPDTAGPEPAPAAADAAPDGERAAWIARMLKQVVEGNAGQRDAAIEALVKGDEGGDCVQPLVALLPEHKKDVPLLVGLIRGLGRDKLEPAALPIAEQLKHRDERVRGNAAVSLEYIGSTNKKVLSALKRFAGREKDVSIANHAYRALGRCGAGAKDGKTRVFLLKKSNSAKSEYASYGPCIGLAYFEGDGKAMRGVEKLLKIIGVPGRSATNAVKRSLVSWTLASIGDEKSGAFVREELIARLEHMKEFWVPGLRRFWQSVAAVCEGNDGEMQAVEDGVRGAVAFVRDHMKLERYGAETRNLMDEYRKGREAYGFTPRGDHILNDKRGDM